METATREIKIQDSVFDAIKWLETEYPHGIELIYIDYRDSYEDMNKLQDIIRGNDENDFEWQADAQWESISEVLKNYIQEIEADELSDETQEAMKDWLYGHDTSNPTKDLLKNTGKKLFYIETTDYSEEDKSNWGKIVRKYSKTKQQKKEIDYVLNNQFYASPISFYFYADVLDIWKAINESQSKYIIVCNAYFTTIDRVQGSNWLGENAIFNLTIPRQNFIDNVYLDDAKGNGYGWGEIAGQSGYDETSIEINNTKKRGNILVKSETSEAQKREMKLNENWNKTKKCVWGDMNYRRHTGSRAYINNYPCGNKCEDCGTFWID